jgi:hypothetical protein
MDDPGSSITYDECSVDLDIVGLKEIAQRLGVKQQTAAAWRYRALLPPEEGTVSGAPAWTWATIDGWARATGRLGGAAEFIAEKTPGWRVMDGAPVEIMAGVVVRQVSAPFPHQMPDGRVERRVRFMAAVDGQLYELPLELYQRGTGSASSDHVGKVLLAAGAVLGAIIVVGEASRGRLPR